MCTIVVRGESVKHVVKLCPTILFSNDNPRFHSTRNTAHDICLLDCEWGYHPSKYNLDFSSSDFSLFSALLSRYPFGSNKNVQHIIKKLLKSLGTVFTWRFYKNWFLISTIVPMSGTTKYLNVYFLSLQFVFSLCNTVSLEKKMKPV